MSKPIVIFGTGGFAEVAHFLFDADSEHEVVAFTAHHDHLEGSHFRGLPLVAFEEIEDRFPPDDFEMFVAVGYRKLNRIRSGLFDAARAKGYTLATYVSSKATVWTDEIGANCFVFEDNTLQPFSAIGDDVILWSGNHVGHHARIGDHCFITSHVVISGYCQVGDHCFIGVNATLRDAITIGSRCLIGAGALIMKSTEEGEVYITPRTKADLRSSDEIDF